MKVTLRLFASLRKYLPEGSPRGYCEINVPAGTAIRGLLERMGIQPGDAQMVVLNGQQERDLDRALRDNDVLSVFPPVAGG